MNIQNKAVRIIGTIVAVLLSTLLVTMLVLVPLFSVTTTITKPEVIVDVVEQIDLGEILLSDDGVQDAILIEGVSNEAIDALLQSSLFEKTIEAYTDDVIGALKGEAAAVPFNEETLKAFAAEHNAELLNLMRQYAPDAAGLSDAQLQSAVDQLVEQYTATFIQALPSGGEMQQILQESQLEQPLSVLVDTTVPVLLYSIIFLLAAVVFACLLHKFTGLLCLGIDALLAALPLAILYAFLSEDGLIASLLEGSDMAAVVQPILVVLSGKLLTALLLLAVAGVLLIVGYILYNQLVFKKKFAPTQMPVESAPAIEEPVESPVE